MRTFHGYIGFFIIYQYRLLSSSLPLGKGSRRYVHIHPVSTTLSPLTALRRGQYGRAAFMSYVTRYGRDSKRRDLLTKILIPEFNNSGKSTPMTDEEIFVEIGNLVFAGTGSSAMSKQSQIKLTMSARRHNEYNAHISLLGIETESGLAALASG